ncbi:MAG: phytoene/squalene synthase family protein [Bacteroidetes bacterium]|nr:phytoene/squalene synthase family protein [Bacteroidota bacterium]
MIALFNSVSNECSRITTKKYSTSFNAAIKLLHADLRTPIYNIYGFVRFADEIVDTFHSFDKKELLAGFKSETYFAIERGISLNPILNSFQSVIHQYHIDIALIDAFFESMEMDLSNKTYDLQGYRQYIYGSAEVVGLMCLTIFCEGNKQQFEELKPAAMALGAAFQKVNFLRDIKADHEQLSRTYFPGVDFKNFTAEVKQQIEEDIEADFKKAYAGLLKLPIKARFGVYIAYKYYFSLFKKIKKYKPGILLQQRVRIPNYYKAYIVMSAGLRRQLNIF